MLYLSYQPFGVQFLAQSNLAKFSKFPFLLKMFAQPVLIN